MTRTLFPLAILALTAGCGEYDDILSLEGDASAGATVYADNCASCHAADGTGGTGPDLTAHVGHHSDEELVGTIVDGSGTMPAFGASLDDQDIADVLAFLIDSWGE